jgi:hypothetical protein
MPNIVSPNEEFLEKTFVEDEIFKIMNPQLYFLDFFPKVESDSKAVSYKFEDTSASTDPKKRKLRSLTPGARFAKVSVSDLKVGAAILTEEGVEIRIDSDARRFAEGLDEIDRAYKRAAFYLAETINSKILDAIKAKVTTTTTAFDPPVEWSDPSAKPIEDLIDIAEDLDQEGYMYELSDVYVHRKEYYDLARHLTFLDVGSEKQREVFGKPNINDTISIPVLDNALVHKLKSSMETQDILVFDREFPAGTYFYTIDPEYQTDTQNDIGFHVHTFKDENTHETVFHLWVESSIAIKEPKAAIFNDGSSAKPI